VESGGDLLPLQEVLFKEGVDFQLYNSLSSFITGLSELS
jgi:hypothetical protein